MIKGISNESIIFYGKKREENFVWKLFSLQTNEFLYNFLIFKLFIWTSRSNFLSVYYLCIYNDMEFIFRLNKNIIGDYYVIYISYIYTF